MEIKKINFDNIGVLGVFIYLISVMVSKAGVNAGLGLMLIGFIAKIIKREKFHLEKEEIIIIIVMILTPIFSLLSPGGTASFKIALQKNYRYFGIFLIPLFITDIKILRNSIIALFLSFGINFVKAFGYFKRAGYDVHARYTSFGGNTLNESHMNMMLIMMSFALIIYAFKNKDMKYKIGSILLFIFILIALILGQGRGAWLGMIGAMGLITFLIAKNKKRYFIIIFISLGIIFISFKTPMLKDNYLVERVKSIKNTKTNSSNKIRLIMWDGAIHIFSEHPVFGVGRDNSWKYYLDYFEKNNKYELLPERSRSSLKDIAGAGNSHNMYMTVLAEQGLLIIGFLGMFGYLFLKEIKFLLKQKKYSYIYCITLGTIGMLVSFLIGGLTENSWQEIWKSNMICGAIGIYIAMKKIVDKEKE